MLFYCANFKCTVQYHYLYSWGSALDLWDLFILNIWNSVPCDQHFFIFSTRQMPVNHYSVLCFCEWSKNMSRHFLKWDIQMATRCIKNDSESLNIREMQIQTHIKYHLIPGSSNGEESTCNAVDLGSIPGLGRFPRERNGHLFQYSCLENPMDRGTWQATFHGVTESDMMEWLTLSHLLGWKWSEVKSLSHVRLFVTPWTVAHQASPSMGFSRQEYWSGLPFPSPGDLPHLGIEPRSPALKADALLSEPPGKSKMKDSKCWWECRKHGKLEHCKWKCTFIQPL